MKRFFWSLSILLALISSMQLQAASTDDAIIVAATAGAVGGAIVGGAVVKKAATNAKKSKTDENVVTTINIRGGIQRYGVNYYGVDSNVFNVSSNNKNAGYGGLFFGTRKIDEDGYLSPIKWYSGISYGYGSAKGNVSVRGGAAPANCPNGCQVNMTNQNFSFTGGVDFAAHLGKVAEFYFGPMGGVNFFWSDINGISTNNSGGAFFLGVDGGISFFIKNKFSIDIGVMYAWNLIDFSMNSGPTGVNYGDMSQAYLGLTFLF